MNVFILSTGRCGSTTFERACRHITNYTAAHESRVHQLGESRLAYKDWHIESDNRLSWFLGRLDQTYGDCAFYVHLLRNPEEVSRSYASRLGEECIIPAYARGIYLSLPRDLRAWSLEISRDYVHTVNSNIEMFLRDKSHKLKIDLADAKSGFDKFWDMICAEGDKEHALKEFDRRHNAHDRLVRPQVPRDSFLTVSKAAIAKGLRAVRKMPGVIKNA